MKTYYDIFDVQVELDDWVDISGRFERRNSARREVLVLS